MAGEGKTTAVCNLAIALTRISRNVVLIDADLRKPRLSTVFGLTNDRGLTDVLRSDEPLSQIDLSALMVKSSIPGLFVVSAGSTSRDGDIDLLHSPRLGEIIERLRRGVDFVLIDTPPIIPVPDARVIARHADGVVLICRASVTDSESLLMALRRLQEDGTQVVGSILNNFDPAEAGKYYKSAGYYRRA
jgi:capsular exopolysaccharide synthesis family protein